MTKQQFQPQQAVPVNERRTAIVDRWIHLHLGKHERCQATTDCPGIAGFQIWSYREKFVTWEQLAARQEHDAPYRISVQLACEGCLKALLCEMLRCDESVALSLINVLTEHPGKRSALSYRYSDELDKHKLAFVHRPTIQACIRELAEVITWKPGSNGDRDFCR